MVAFFGDVHVQARVGARQDRPQAGPAQGGLALADDRIAGVGRGRPGFLGELRLQLSPPLGELTVIVPAIMVKSALLESVMDESDALLIFTL